MTASADMKVIDVSNRASPTIAGSLPSAGYVKGRNGKLFSFNGAVYAFSLANPILPVVENSSAVPPPAPSAGLDVSQLSFPAATWVGNYLIGMMYASAASYNGARALPFTAN